MSATLRASGGLLVLEALLMARQGARKARGARGQGGPGPRQDQACGMLGGG